MTRCLSPIPPDPPGEALTQTTCAVVQVGNGGGGPPSVCPCPDNILLNTQNNISYFFDYQWVNKIGTINPYIYLLTFEVNNEGKQYNQKFVHPSGECPAQMAPTGERLEIEVNNLVDDRRVTCTKYSNTGAVQKVYFNYDATAEFSTGQTQWVTIVSTETTGNRHKIWAYINDVQVGENDEVQQYLSNFVELKRSGSIAGQVIPFGFWYYSQTTEQCLTSGNFNGFGGCPVIDQKNALRWDRGQTDQDIDLLMDDRVAIPKDGLSTRRSAYLITPDISGRVYWEVSRSPSPVCLASNYAIGAAVRGLDLGTNYTGEVPNSWGLLAPLGNLISEGNVLYSNFTMLTTRFCFCYDNNTRELWLAHEVSPGGGIQWLGGGVPGGGATSFELFQVQKDLQLTFSPIDFPEPQYVVSSERSCRYEAPPTFGYLV